MSAFNEKLEKDSRLKRIARRFCEAIENSHSKS
jgi:hypothetical protein